MNIYTLDDARKLAQIYEGSNIPNGLTEEELSTFGGNFSYIELMESIIKEKKMPGASLMEFLGAYEMVGNTSENWDMLRDFLFEALLNEMPQHINDSGSEGWKNKVAQWRLSINK